VCPTKAAVRDTVYLTGITPTLVIQYVPTVSWVLATEIYTNTNTNTNNLFPPLPMRYNEMHNMISILIKIGTI
jgi:hypothetical protein